MARRIKRMSWLTFLISLNSALFILSLWAVVRIYFYKSPRQTAIDILLDRQTSPQLVDYKDFISIMLAGLSAMITVLGIGLATIAIWGFAQIKSEARNAAEGIAREVTAQNFARLNRERLSAAEARAELEKTPGVSVEMVQNLVDALTGDDEREGRNR